MSSSYNILFAANDPIAFKTLESVCSCFNVVGVLSGKGRAEPQIAAFARQKGIPVLIPESLRQPERDEITSLGADFLLSFSISRVFGPKFLSLFKLGTMNIHPSSLPELRGPSPLQYSILNGLTHSEISFQKISAGIDEGDIYFRVPFEIAKDEDTATLREKVSVLAAENIVGVLNDHIESAVPQSGEASYSAHISKEDGKIDFTKDSALTIDRKIRAYCLWPKCFCDFNGELLFLEDAEPVTAEMISAETASMDKISAGATGAWQTILSDAVPGQILGFDIKCGCMKVKTIDGILLVRKVRKDKRKSTSAVDFYNGNRKAFGQVVILK